MFLLVYFHPWRKSMLNQKAGSPQRILLERRIKALKFAVQAIAGSTGNKQ